MKNLRKQLKAQGRQANERIQNLKFGTLWKVVKMDSRTLTNQLWAISKGNSGHQFNSEEI